MNELLIIDEDHKKEFLENYKNLFLDYYDSLKRIRSKRPWDKEIKEEFLKAGEVLESIAFNMT